jgi:hypothetical protein
MTLLFAHISIADLSDFHSGLMCEPRRSRVATHLRGCARCQGQLRFVTRLTDVNAMPSSEAPSEILARALAARAVGERQILNIETRGILERSRRRRRLAMFAAAAVAGVAVLLVVTRTSELNAVSSHSELRMSPARPHTGDTIRVTYRPASAVLQRASRLVLRARLRTAKDDMYPGAVPGVRVRAIARLDRRTDGTYDGRFALADSIVFATLVVEDEAAEHLDDNDGRAWEILAYSADGRPLYDALNERANDMMGRSWEEAYASVVQLSTLYPDRFTAWTLREFFDRAMLGTPAADSLDRQYEPRIDSLIAARKAQSQISGEEAGDIFFRSLAKQRGGSALDSADFRYWRDRLLREHPRHSQVAQYYAFNFQPDDWKRPAWMLDSLERLYAKLAPVSGVGRNLFNAALQVASRSPDDAAYRRWTERSWAGSPDSVYRTALALVSRASLRGDGERGLREALAGPAERLAPFRRLTETQREYTRRVGDVRRTVLVALGRALAADGHMRAATDTLGLAANGVWNLQVFHALTAAYLMTGDTAAADRIRAREVVDPRTAADSVQTISAAARMHVGGAAWDSLLSSARDEMHQRFLERSKMRALHSTPHVETSDGKSLALRAITGGKPTAVIFWSKDCGWAVQALPQIARVAERLMRLGTPVVLVAGEHPSPEVAAFLAQHGWKLPVYYDSGGEMQNAFANFGTPQYYAIDAAGRMRFDAVQDDEAELIGQLEALQSEKQP